MTGSVAQLIPLHERPFSALALRLYSECPLRFRRRYIDGLYLTGGPDDPDEQRALLQGERFHLMARRYFSGMEPGTLGDPADRAELMGWMDMLRRYLPRRPEYTYYPELELRLCETQALAPDDPGSPPALPVPAGSRARSGASAPTGGRVQGGQPDHPAPPTRTVLRLMAKFDLLVVAPDGQATIYDWKTLRHMPPRARLESAFQTMVYRYVLCAAGGPYAPGGAFDPDRVAMVYWNPLRGGREVRIPYSRAQFEEDGRRLREVVAEILATPPDGFRPTGDSRICARCEYGQLCHGPLAAWASEPVRGADGPVEEEGPQEVPDVGFDGMADLPLP